MFYAVVGVPLSSISMFASKFIKNNSLMFYAVVGVPLSSISMFESETGSFCLMILQTVLNSAKDPGLTRNW